MLDVEFEFSGAGGGVSELGAVKSGRVGTTLRKYQMPHKTSKPAIRKSSKRKKRKQQQKSCKAVKEESIVS